MARKTGRTQNCSAADARKRLADARKFLDVAEMVADESDPELEYGGVAAADAVLAGVAASDAACCKALGVRSRSQDHRDAIRLLDQIEPDGKKAGKNLRSLLDLKDTAHYGFISVSGKQLRGAIRQTRHLVEFAEQVLAR